MWLHLHNIYPVVKTNVIFYNDKVYLPCKGSELHVMFCNEKSYSLLALLVVCTQYVNHQNSLTKILKKYKYSFFQLPVSMDNKVDKCRFSLLTYLTICGPFNPPWWFYKTFWRFRKAHAMQTWMSLTNFNSKNWPRWSPW